MKSRRYRSERPARLLLAGIAARAHVAALAWALFASGGCSQMLANDAPSDQLDVREILTRCAAAHRSAKTLSATGLLIDDRGSRRRVEPLSWDYASPARSRLQIGMDVSCVGSDFWWVYESAGGRFRTPPRSSPTPMETSSYMLTDRVVFLPASLAERGDAVFAMQDDRYEPWRLEGAAWLEGRPCYRLACHGRGTESENRWTLWIDQDSLLVRAWAWQRQLPDGTLHDVWRCSFSTIQRDTPIPPERFGPAQPQPIELPMTANAVAPVSNR